jgi:hypothetical protein
MEVHDSLGCATEAVRIAIPEWIIATGRGVSVNNPAHPMTEVYGSSP